MKFSIKNNNIYYYHYPIFNGELSPLLVPLLIILIVLYDKYIKFFSFLIILLGVVGIYDSYLKSKKYNLLLILIAGIIMHIIGFYPLINIKKYMPPNLVNYVLSLVAIFVIKFLPYWPYELSRNNMIILLLLINIISTFYYLYKF